MTDEPEIATNEAPVLRKRSAEIDKLAGALAKAQGAMGNAEKNAENPGFKRDGKNATYATLGAVWDAVRKPLSDNGLCILQWPRTVEGGVEIETEIMHETGQFMRDILWMPCPQMTVHTVGSAITYGRRYALMSIVGIAPEDDDGNAAADSHTGAPGSAGGGGQFRPAKRTGWAADAERDGTLDTTREKGKLPTKGADKIGREATPEEARRAKITAATNKRIDALKSQSTWTRDTLDQFWNADRKWIDWMADPVNEALKEYERFTDAYADAEMNIKPVELA